MAVPFHRAAGFEASGVLLKAPGGARSAAGYSGHQGFMGAPSSADMLGSQANETVLVEQPEAYITQKARVKRNRRTEWDYYVQFPGFSDDEGMWYSARAIKTSHPRGTQLIREFEHPNDSPEPSPQPSALQRQPAPTQLAGLQTQDVGPSQIGGQSLYEADTHSSYAQPHTQDLFASQLQQPADHIFSTAPPTHSTTHAHQPQGLQAASAQTVFNTASQKDLPLPLHWSFDRMQQAAYPRPQQQLHPSAQVPCLPPAQLQSAPVQPVHTLPIQYAHPQANMPQAKPYTAPPYQFARRDQGTLPDSYPPGGGADIHRDWSRSQQPQWHSAQGQTDLAMSGPQYPPHPASTSSAVQYQQPLRQPLSYLPFQQQQQQQEQQLARQHAPLPSSHAHHSVSVQESVATAHGHPEAQQLPKPGFTSAAGFQLPLQASQQHTEAESGSRRAATGWVAQPPSQPATADTVPVHSAGQQAVQTEEGPADSKLHGANASDILGQQASLWRQAASKRSALADLVPAADRLVGTLSASRDAPVSAGGLPLMQPVAVQEGCAAFKPAVQACIAAARLPLTTPFYQQAVEHAMERHTQHKAVVSARQESRHPDDVKQEALDVGGPKQSMQEAAALADDGSAAAVGAHHRSVTDSGMPAQQQQQQLAQRPASPAPSSDSDLGTDLPDEEAKTQARKHICVECWDGARICGARRVGEGLELHVKWDDGYDAWMSLEALKKRQHCKSAIIDFLVSKVRRKTKG